MFKKNQIKNRYGFSLIEITIVVSIVGIISAVGLSSLDNIRTNSQLKVAQKKLLTDVKTAQNYALQGKMQLGNTVCGYGIHFENDKKKYEIYYNKLDTNKYLTCEDQNEDQNYRKYRTTNPVSVAVVSKSLPNGVSLSDTDPAKLFFDIPHSNIFKSNGKPINSSDYANNLTLVKPSGFGPVKRVNKLITTHWISF